VFPEFKIIDVSKNIGGWLGSPSISLN